MAFRTSYNSSSSMLPSSGAFRVSGNSPPGRIAGYSADEVDGINEYLATILAPEAFPAREFPDGDLNARICKSVKTNQTLTGSTNYLLWYTPQSKLTIGQIYTSTTPNGPWVYQAEIPVDQVISENYAQMRYVSGLLRVSSSTIASGLMSVQGQVWAVGYQDPVSFFNIPVDQITVTRFNEAASLENHLVADGAVVLGQPTINPRFEPPTTNAINVEGPSVELTFMNRNPAFAGFPQSLAFAPTQAVVADFIYWDSNLSPGILPPLLRGRTNLSTSLVLPSTFVPTATTRFLIRVTTVNGVSVDIEQPIYTAGYNEFSTEFLSTVPISRIVTFIAAPPAFNWVNPWTAVPQIQASVSIHNDNFLRPGEVSNGSFVVVTGVDATQVITLGGCVNYEVVPNSNLSVNLKSAEPKVAAYHDIEAARFVLSHPSTYPFKWVFKNSEYQAFLKDVLPRLIMRERIRGQALGLFDVFKTLAPAAVSLLPSTYQPIANMGLNALLGSSKPTGRAKWVDIEDIRHIHNDFVKPKRYPKIGKSARRLIGYAMFPKNQYPISKIKHMPPPPKTIPKSEEKDDKKDRPTGSAMDASEYKTRLVPQESFSSARVITQREPVQGSTYFDDSTDWMNYFTTAYANKLSSQKIYEKLKMKIVTATPVSLQRFPIVLSDGVATVVTMVLTAKPWKFNPTEREKLAVYSLISSNTMNLYVSDHFTPSSMTAINNVVRTIGDTYGGNFYLTLYDNYYIEGNSLGAALYCLLTGYPDLGPLTGGVYLGPSNVTFLPIGGIKEKILAAKTIGANPLLACVGDDLTAIQGFVTIGADIVATGTFEVSADTSLIIVNCPSDLMTIMTNRHTAKVQQNLNKAPVQTEIPDEMIKIAKERFGNWETVSGLQRLMAKPKRSQAENVKVQNALNAISMRLNSDKGPSTATTATQTQMVQYLATLTSGQLQSATATMAEIARLKNLLSGGTIPPTASNFINTMWLKTSKLRKKLGAQQPSASELAMPDLVRSSPTQLAPQETVALPGLSPANESQPVVKENANEIEVSF